MKKKTEAILVAVVIIAFTMACQPKTVIVEKDPEIMLTAPGSLPAIQTPHGPAYPYSNGTHTCYILEYEGDIVSLGCVR